MESSIQGSESIEDVRVDLESVLVELESVHRRSLPRNTFELAKFGFLRPIYRDPCMESSIQGSESIERVRVDLESVLVELESVHRRILPRNTFELGKFGFLRQISSFGIVRGIDCFWLESVHRRFNTKFSCFLGHCFGIIYVWIRGIFDFGERYHRIELVKIYLESGESGLESIHGRIVQRNTRIWCQYIPRMNLKEFGIMQ